MPHYPILFTSLMLMGSMAALPASNAAEPKLDPAVTAAKSTAPAFATSAKLEQMSEAERHAQAARTEVWEPMPPLVSFDKHNIPSDAVILLGNDLSAWRSAKDGGKASWQLEDGVLTVKPGSGDIRTVESFCDIQLHLEWQSPAPKQAKTGQLRNNSGIFLQEKYEVQILDSYQNPTYPNGQAGSVYKQSIPLANAMRPTGEWQVYDIIYKAPRFQGDKRISPGYITVLHNGVLVQNHTEILGTTEWIGPPQQVAHGCAPLKLQDHGDKVSFRNIWARKL